MIGVRGWLACIASCAVLMASVPSKAEHGSPWLRILPPPENPLPPSGRVTLLSGNGHHRALPRAGQAGLFLTSGEERIPLSVVDTYEDYDGYGEAAAVLTPASPPGRDRVWRLDLPESWLEGGPWTIGAPDVEPPRWKKPPVVEIATEDGLGYGGAELVRLAVEEPRRLLVRAEVRDAAGERRRALWGLDDRDWCAFTGYLTVGQKPPFELRLIAMDEAGNEAPAPGPPLALRGDGYLCVEPSARPGARRKENAERPVGCTLPPDVRPALAAQFPTDEFAPSWSVRLEDACDGAAGHHLLGLADGSLVRLAPLAVEAFALATGARTARVSAEQARARTPSGSCGGVGTIATPDERSVVAGGRIVGALDWGELGAFAPADASLAWKTQLGFFVSAVERYRDGAVVVAGLAGGEKVATIAVVDAASGAVRWRAAPLASTDSRLTVQGLVVDGDRGWLLVQEGGYTPSACVVVGFDPRTGAAGFVRSSPMSGTPTVCSLGRSEGHLLVTRGDEGYSLLDACDGSVLADVDLAGQSGAGGAVLAGGRVLTYVEAPRALTERLGRDPRPVLAVAYDAASGAEQWRHRTPLVAMPPLLVGPWAVVQSYGGEIRALDVATGALRWSWSFGTTVRVQLVPEIAPRWLLAVGHDGTLAAFDLQRPATRAPPGRTPIRGRIVAADPPWRRPPRWVRVGHVPVPVDRDGRFASEPAGAGHVRVVAVVDDVVPSDPLQGGCPYTDAVSVPLDGRTHDVRLSVSFGGCD